MALFAELNARGTTLLMITHEPEVARCAKKIYHIRDGVLSTGEGAGA